MSQLQISQLPPKPALISTDQFGVDDATAITNKVTAAQIQTLIAPLTTKGDILTNNGTVNIRLPVGTDHFVLTADSAQTNGVAWEALPIPFTTKGDLLTYSGTANVRLPVGTNTFVLTADSTQTNGIAWEAIPNPLTTKGDILTNNGSTNVRLPVGTNTFVLTADSAQTNGVAWEALPVGLAPQICSYALNSSVVSSSGTISWDTKIVDPSTIYSSPNVTPTLPGWYFCTAQITGFTLSAADLTLTITGSHASTVNITGTATLPGSGAAENNTATATGFIFCNGSGDTISFSFSCTGTVTIGGDTTKNRFTVQRTTSS